MKILIVTHYFFPHVGGIEIVAYNQAKELVKAGHQVTIVTSKLSGDKSIESKNHIKIKRVPAINPLENKFHVPYPIYSPQLLATLKSEIKNTDIVILHGAIYLGSIVGAVLAKLAKKPVYLFEHVGLVKYNNNLLNQIQHFAFRTAGKLVLSLSDKVFVLNNNIRQYLSQFTTQPISIFNNGVDTDLFHPVTTSKKIQLRKKYHLPLKSKLCLFVGRFVQKKGIDLLLASKRKGWELVLVGSGNIDSKLITPNVHILKNLSQDKLAEIYQTCDLFVLPSRSEGFPLSILEAMASGLPIVTTGKEYLVSVNKKLIKFIQPNKKSLDSAVSSVISTASLRNQMSIYSRHLATSRYSWSNSISMLKI